MRSNLRKVGGILIAAALVVGPAAIFWWQRWNILDWFKLRNYHPPANVAALASEDTMTPYGRKLFYINHPQVVSGASNFRQDCSESEQTIVLGCYHSIEAGIYLFNPNNPKLAGVEQVTAAHEMLHAAYDRLSSHERNYVDGLLENYYEHSLTSARIKNEIALYQKTEPGDVVNEMHSVFGTEAPNLPTALENYYQRYFTDRAKVVAYGSQYQAAFDNLQTQVSADDAQLASLRAQISSDEASLQAEADKINADRSRLDKEKSSDPATYNAQVDAFNTEVDTYNSGVTSLQAEVSRYNQLVAARNQIAASLASLEKSIDTRLTTQSTQ